LYGFDLSADLTPGDSLLGRIWREFHRQTPTLTPLAKVKNLLGDKLPVDRQRVNVAAGVTLELEGLPQDDPVHSLLDAYWRLRILMNTWAFAGSWDVDSMATPGTKTRMVSYTQASHYADWALKQCQERGGGRVSWLIEKDTLTRGIAVNHMRRGWPAGEALQLALTETKSDWREKDATNAPPIKRERDWPASPTGKGGRDKDDDTKRRRTNDSSPGSRRMEGSPGGKSKGKGKSTNFFGEQVMTVSTFPGGSKACKPFNDARGCSNKSCKDEHSCDRLIKATGKACRGRHPRSACRA
jgi:hypothetical protein